MALHDPIDAVVFDIGGVLLDWNPRHLYRKLFLDQEEMERFLAEICTLEWHHHHDLGLALTASCSKLAAAHPEYGERIWAWAMRTEEMIAGPIDGTIGLLAELKHVRTRCYALTNMERETYAIRQSRYDFFAWFDGVVVSSHEGVAKPDPEIFRRLLDRFELDPATTLMVDDSARNIAAATNLGLQAIRFESPEQLRGALAQGELRLLGRR